MVKTTKFDSSKACPMCGSSNIVYKQKEDQTICRDCGHIFEETPEGKEFEKAHS